jgi:hypothetical protein
VAMLQGFNYRRNMYTQNQPRKHRLPVVAVTADEKRRVHKVAEESRVPVATLQRLGLVAIGALEWDSVEELPDSVLREYLPKLMLDRDAAAAAEEKAGRKK